MNHAFDSLCDCSRCTRTNYHTQTVVLEVIWNEDNNFGTPPSDWDWASIAGLNYPEDIHVIAQGPNAHILGEP